MYSPYSINIPQDCLQSLVGKSEGRVNLIIMYQRYILCSNRRERASISAKGIHPRSLSHPFYVTFVTKPSIKPLTTDRFEKPLSFSFVRVFSALYRKNQSRNSYHFLDLAARKLHAHRQTDRQTDRQTHILLLLLRLICKRIWMKRLFHLVALAKYCGYNALFNN